MKIFADDGSTAIKLKFTAPDGTAPQQLVPVSFKRQWSVPFGGTPVYNYTMEGELYSFDPVSPDALVTTNVEWQYSNVNVVAVHHALLLTGVEPCEVDLVVTLPLSEYYDAQCQPNAANIARKRASLMRPVTVNGGKTFTVRSVEVMPESIPAGYDILKEMEPLESLLIVDLGGTTLDISQVMGQMAGITRIHGDASVGVSLMTEPVSRVLASARTQVSNYLANDVIQNRRNRACLEGRLNDVEKLPELLSVLETSEAILTRRVIEAVSTFKGYSRAMVIGGGGAIVAPALEAFLALREGRFYRSGAQQFDLVCGMYNIG